MANTRTFYAVKQLSVKNNEYANNSILLDALQLDASGAVASGATEITVIDNDSYLGAIDALPSVGQFITPSGEVIKYTIVDGASSSGAVLGGVTRGFTATQPTAIEDADTLKFAGWEVVHGVQSVGVTTNFSLEQVFEFGQIEIYENIEALPEIEVTVERTLDGTKPMWFSVTTVPAGMSEIAIGMFLMGGS